MSNTNLTVEGYKDSYATLNGKAKMKITRFDIARGLISIGKPHWSQRYLKRVSLADLISFWTSIRYRIDEKPNLVINEEFEKLDASKKNDKSYNIGMGITCIVAERVLKIACMQDVDALHAAGILKITEGTKERGDLAGLDVNGKWHILESKGRTYPHSVTHRQKAKRQAERITSIGGVPPETKGYCMTYINKRKCNILLSDPDDQPPQRLDLAIEKGAFIKFYYEKIFGDYLIKAPDLTVVFAGLTFACFRLNTEDEGTFIAIEQRILEYLQYENYEEILSLHLDIYERAINTDLSDGSLGVDGIMYFEGNPLELPPGAQSIGIDRPVVDSPELDYVPEEPIRKSYQVQQLKAMEQ